MKKILILFAILAANFSMAQVRGDVQKQADGYEWPTDPAVLQKLDQWQDLKFGVLMHWGIYATQGMVESWAICNEEWIRRAEGSVYEDYKKWYWDLSKEFNPVNFNPEQWADVFTKAGMKYMIFTTKHHDGFCMFDSKYTDFSIANGPFSNNPRKDVAKYVFNAFRNKDFMVGAYFSKPDWHHHGFWNPYYATPNRRPNYNLETHKDWWDSYVQFTQNQLLELTTGKYGKVDILWLDGGWISGDEVGLDEVLPKSRAYSPGMLCVDRTIQGPNENYQTPEQSIPNHQIDHPWESCITLTHSWGWSPNVNFKSARKVIDLLSEITAKGGSLVLGVGPTPDGVIEDRAIPILEEIGEWLGRCGEAIYSTRITPEYNDGDIWFNASKDGKTLYAIYALKDDEKLPETLTWKGNLPKDGKVVLLNNGKTLRATVKDDEVTVKLPKNLKQEPLALKYTRTFPKPKKVVLEPLPMQYGDASRSKTPFAKDPTVIRHGDEYLMYYSVTAFDPEPDNSKPPTFSDWHSAIARSKDLVNWTRVCDLDLRDTKGNKLYGAVAPCVRKLDGKIHIFYQMAWDGTDGVSNIWHAMSEDGITFNNTCDRPIIVPITNWSIKRSIDAEVYRVGDKLILLFATRDKTATYQIMGMAQAPYGCDYGPDKWTLLSVDGPLFQPEYPWEMSCTEAPTVIRHKGIWYMFYAGAYNHEGQQIGLATSKDGYHFERIAPEGLLFTHGAKGTWNEGESGHPGVFQDDDGQVYLFFQGKASLNETYYLSVCKVHFE